MLTLAGKPLAVPVLQGGMGVGVSLGGLAGAVAAGRGMGCISTADTGYREPDFARDPCAANLRALKKEIAKAKEIAGGAGTGGHQRDGRHPELRRRRPHGCGGRRGCIVSGAGLPLELPGLVEKADVALAPIVSSGRAQSSSSGGGQKPSTAPPTSWSSRAARLVGIWAFRKKSFWPENARPSTRSCPKCWPR